ncbi:FecR family protein [Chitinophaga sp. G-6-1-13]|uniref:FecR family protein n=1 Tax=Chitinophaga fulva TaxID=2728842 RepID=A0A848GMG3_9BACT|nr:FecR family protein [Chitinophaga fulva]NML38801.1 FecR family protein [Chitinophaga fulva]
MDNQQERLHFLFNKYLSDTITAGEQEELWALIDTLATADDFPESIRAAWNDPPKRDVFTGVDSVHILDSILRQPKKRPVATLISKHWWKIAASLLMLFGIRFFFQSRAVKPTASRHAPTLPAQKKVVLTLSNGEPVVLDDKAAGTIARQGDILVIKHTDGSLSYTRGSNSSSADSYNTVSTPTGSQYHLELPDGTKVWLNAASSIKYPLAFSPQKRNVEISGEVFFDVAQQAAVPFEVSSGDMQVQVLGTSFNIMAYKDEGCIKTTLITGMVKVIKGTGSCQLRPGTQAVLPSGGNNFQLVKADVQEVLAWKEGEFRFRDADISSIMRQAARWYDVEVSYQGPLPSNKFYGVIPRQHNISELLEVLEMTGHVHFRTMGRKIIVISGAK